MPCLARVLSEENQSWVVVGKDRLDVIFAEGDEDWDGGTLCEFNDIVLVALARVLKWRFIESAGKGDAGATESELGGAFDVACVVELEVLRDGWVLG